MEPTKKDVALAILTRGSMFVHLDPRKPGVIVPEHLRRQAQVVLQFGWQMPVPIGDMQVESDHISGIMSFKGKQEFCYVPWSAAFALIGEDARGMVYGKEIPAEIAAQMEASAKKPDLKPANAPARSNVVSFADAKRRLRPNAQPKGSPFKGGA